MATLALSGFLLWRGIDPLLQNLQSEERAIAPSSLPTNILGEGTKVATISTKIQRKGVKVTKVIDGDTIEVEMDNKSRKVRYIGVNTPETVDPRRGVECFGREASNENKRLVLEKDVILEKDISETDKFGRLLRFVYLPLEDGSTLFVNDYLVREGFAYASTYPPDVKFSDQFKAAEQQAREGNRGLWGRCN